MISASFFPVIGGLQFQVKYLVESLAEKGLELFLLSYNEGESFLSKKVSGFLKFTKIKYKHPQIIGCIELYNLIRKISPDVIHVHGAENIAFQIALLKSLKLISQPFIVTSHGVDIMTCREINYGVRLNPILALKIKFVLNKCTKHVIVGRSMKRFAIEAGSTEGKVVEINNGVPLIDKKISEEKLISVSAKYGISSNEHILLSLSGMRPLKGLEYLIKAMPKILKHFPDTKLVLACEGGSYEQYIRNLIQFLKLDPNVIFAGFIRDEEEKIALIRRCDIFCKPSLLEACSVAILEAMREGKVVVASIPGGIDIITHNRNGLLTQVKDPDDFADAVIKVLKNQKLKDNIEDCAKKDIANFDIHMIADQYISLYKEIITTRPFSR